MMTRTNLMAHWTHSQRDFFPHPRLKSHRGRELPEGGVVGRFVNRWVEIRFWMLSLRNNLQSRSFGLGSIFYHPLEYIHKIIHTPRTYTHTLIYIKVYPIYLSIYPFRMTGLELLRSGTAWVEWDGMDGMDIIFKF